MRMFISQPYEARTDRQTEYEFKQTLGVASKLLQDLGHECVSPRISQTDIEVSGAKNTVLWCLSASLAKIATCDGVYFLKGWKDCEGCRLELEACKTYGVAIFFEK